MVLRRIPGLRARLAASSIPAVLQSKATPKKRPSPKVEQIRARVEAAWTASQQDTWKGTGPEQSGPLLVGLWAKLHEEIYEVDVVPTLATGSEWMKATVAAKRVAHRLGDVGVALEFVTWAWRAEERQERRRRSGEIDNEWRMSWQNLFLRPGTVLDFLAVRRRG